MVSGHFPPDISPLGYFPPGHFPSICIIRIVAYLQRRLCSPVCVCVFMHACNQFVLTHSRNLFKGALKWVLRCYVGGNVWGKYPRGEMSRREMSGGNVRGGNIQGEMSCWRRGMCTVGEISRGKCPRLVRLCPGPNDEERRRMDRVTGVAS